ncbi:MAG TPA: T9SS type A sorting domain-containing protein, partial [Chryseolinea sp.]
SQWASLGNGTHGGSATAGTETSGSAASTFIAFTLASNNATNPLPIELLEFNARFADPHIAIQWKTATETNNDYFTLEKSRNGYAWTVLDTIDGAGNSTLPLSYAYNDLNPRSGLQYYRLTQTDFDGTFKTSNVVSVNVEADLIEDIILYPNPTTGDVNVGIRLDDKSYLIKLSDSNGRLIREFVLENTNKTTLPVAGLPRGIYFVEVLSSQGTSRSKLVLQ